MMEGAETKRQLTIEVMMLAERQIAKEVEIESERQVRKVVGVSDPPEAPKLHPRWMKRWGGCGKQCTIYSRLEMLIPGSL